MTLVAMARTTIEITEVYEEEEISDQTIALGD